MRIVIIALLAVAGCAGHVRQPEVPTGPSLKVMTWNVNWGGPGAGLAVRAILDADADIVCLQETTPAWEKYLREQLSARYPFMAFSPADRRLRGAFEAQTPQRYRIAGGLAFLAKEAGVEVAFVPSVTGWFDSLIMQFQTPIGPVQVNNVHLQPIANDKGSFTIAAYFSSGGRHEREIERFHAPLKQGVPAICVGDFNEGDGGSAVEWLEEHGMTSALPEFDRSTDTWQWDLGWITLHKRLDHTLYSPELHCHSASVLKAGASDHLPVVAVFGMKQSATGTDAGEATVEP